MPSARYAASKRATSRSKASSRIPSPFTLAASGSEVGVGGCGLAVGGSGLASGPAGVRAPQAVARTHNASRPRMARGIIRMPEGHATQPAGLASRLGAGEDQHHGAALGLTIEEAGEGLLDL